MIFFFQGPKHALIFRERKVGDHGCSYYKNLKLLPSVRGELLADTVVCTFFLFDVDAGTLIQPHVIPFTFLASLFSPIHSVLLVVIIGLGTAPI